MDCSHYRTDRKFNRMNSFAAVRRRFGLCCWLVLAWPLIGRAALPDLPQVASNLVVREEGFWKGINKPLATTTARDVFAYALILCETRQHPERLERLFELAGQMQDRDPQSHTYGNFWWALRDDRVLDANAVDFCMRSGSLLWLKHRDFIPAPARARLETLLDVAVEGCLRHKVAASYSNIAIMNAGDLILLGEALGIPPAADEGYARLDRVYRYTQTFGIHEYNSPTYTGVDVDGLGLIKAYCRREGGRTQAESLLEFWWTDIALNWFPPAQKLAGTQSRTYDYPHGLGELDRLFGLAGWLPEPPAPGIDAIFSEEGDGLPPSKIRALSENYPRLVRERWGEDWWQARTHFLQPDITLSSASASYGGRMDMPLTADLPGDRKSVRCYFIADGRDDPYGMNKLPAGAHQKAFHLDPFWTAAQRNGDALGLVIYRLKDIPAIATTLESDFVMPLNVDSFWIAGRQIIFTNKTPSRLPVAPGETVILRKGTAALGLRVPWSRTLNGQAAKCFLIYDGNSLGAVRLTVEESAGAKPLYIGTSAEAALWLRAGSGLKTDADFAKWQKDFTAATVDVAARVDGIQIKAAGVDGPVSVSASAPWSAPDSLEPAATISALELNGKDSGVKILGPAKPKPGQ